MKKILSFTLLCTFFAIPAAFAKGGTEYTCLAKRFRNDEDGIKTNARFNFRLKTHRVGRDRVHSIERFIGHVAVKRPGDDNPGSHYYSVFKIDRLAQNMKYKPRKYKNYIQFKDVETSLSSSVDGGGMWGSFVLSPDRKKARYIMQSGDHLGGTIDFKCYTRF